MRRTASKPLEAFKAKVLVTATKAMFADERPALRSHIDHRWRQQFDATNGLKRPGGVANRSRSWARIDRCVSIRKIHWDQLSFAPGGHLKIKRFFELIYGSVR